MLNDVMSKPRLLNPDLYTLSIYTLLKAIVYYRLFGDRIFFDKVFVSEYKLFKRSNNVNLFIIKGLIIQLPNGKWQTQTKQWPTKQYTETIDWAKGTHKQNKVMLK